MDPQPSKNQTDGRDDPLVVVRSGEARRIWNQDSVLLRDNGCYTVKLHGAERAICD